MNLFQLAGNWREFKNVFDESDRPDELKDTLESIESSIEAQGRNIYAFIKELEAEKEAVKKLEETYYNRKKTLDNKINWLKQHAQAAMEIHGIDKIKTDIGTMSIQNNPGSVEITDADAIPAEYVTVIPAQYQPDKKRIAEAIKDGREVAGARLVVTRRLQLR